MESAPEPEVLLSLPPQMVPALPELEPGVAAECFATCDPPDAPLGSGGGTVHVLEEAFRARGSGCPSLDEWLDASRKIVVHGGGQSRRLPGYAAAGKLFIPMPVLRWTLGQRLDQNLLQMQLPLLRRLCGLAAARSRVLVASGDVLVRTESLPASLPDADVVLVGLWTTPDHARDFGVFFCEKEQPERLVTFLQKPSVDRIRELAEDHLYLIDIGIWLLSERAVELLISKSHRGGDDIAYYDLYGEWGLHLGARPEQPDPEFESLTTAVVPLAGAEFYHFGTNRDLIDSNHRLQNVMLDQTRMGGVGVQGHPQRFILNSIVEAPLDPVANHALWIENCHLAASWRLSDGHTITGVPDNAWQLELRPGQCLHFVPVGDSSFAIQTYQIDDVLGGDGDFDEPRHPVVDVAEIDAGWLQWLVDGQPDGSFADHFEALPKLSSRQIGQQTNLVRLYWMRGERLAAILPLMAADHSRSVFYALDLEATAELFAPGGAAIPEVGETNRPMLQVRDHMFRAAVLRKRGEPGDTENEALAFDALREAMVEPFRSTPVHPRRNVFEDQIVWGRSPARMDLAGGWSDTPPYSLEFGGAVMNIAVDLNGQPPIQAYARLREGRELVIRSIDLGIEERITSYEQLGQFHHRSSGFAIARAAFALCGFFPSFNGKRYQTLADQLDEFGHGIELSMLAALPKGSGMGTSSIIAATLLGTLAELGDLNWDFVELMRRTSALEQLLTSGGGWQDQAGGLLRGGKLVETAPGLDQSPTVRWVPDSFFEQASMQGRTLLYYTGITRVAHNILGEIVRGIFLNRREHLSIIHRIRENASFCYDAILRNDSDAFLESIRRSWILNQRLDSGTNPPEIQAILERCADHIAATKLPGAGGGGYLLMFAHDHDSAVAIRRELTQNPPNEKARFVEMNLSKTGFQVTRS